MSKTKTISRWSKEARDEDRFQYGFDLCALPTSLPVKQVTPVVTGELTCSFCGDKLHPHEATKAVNFKGMRHRLKVGWAKKVELVLSARVDKAVSCPSCIGKMFRKDADGKVSMVGVKFHSLED